MPLTYDINYSPDFAGLRATVRNSAGTEVSGSPVTLDANGHGSLSLNEGRYTATVSNTARALNNAQTDLVLNVPGSIEADAGGSPTADTAFLIATGTIAADNTAVALALAFDSRYTNVDWLTIANGAATIPNGAGKCVVGLIAGGSANFTGASATPSASGLVDGSTLLYINGDSGTLGTTDEIVGNGQTVQNFNDAGPVFATNPINFAPGDELTITASVAAYTDDAYEDLVTGAHATFTACLAITRGGSAPTLP